MKIEPIPFESDRFYVHSDSGEIYMVDITNDKEDFGCTCNSFIMAKAPNVEKGVPLYTPETCCKHINSVLKYVNEI